MPSFTAIEKEIVGIGTVLEKINLHISSISKEILNVLKFVIDLQIHIDKLFEKLEKDLKVFLKELKTSLIFESSDEVATKIIGES